MDAAFWGIRPRLTRRNSVSFIQKRDTPKFCPVAPASQLIKRRSTLYRYSCRGIFRRVSQRYLTRFCCYGARTLKNTTVRVEHYD